MQDRCMHWSFLDLGYGLACLSLLALCLGSWLLRLDTTTVLWHRAPKAEPNSM